MFEKLLNEYYNQLENYEDTPNFDINNFNYSILSNKENVINHMLDKLDVTSLKNDVEDNNIVLLFEGYLSLSGDDNVDDIEEYYNVGYEFKGSRYDKLSSDDELRIFIDYNNEKNNSKKIKIRNEIIEHNLRLVRKCAYKYRGMCNFLEVDDLISYGTQGIIIAIDKFDYTKGFKFSTYATLWIHQTIKRAISNYKSTVRIPVSQENKINKIKAITNNLVKQNGVEPSITEIAEAANLDEKNILEIMALDKSVISLNSPVGDDSETTLEEMISVNQKDVDETYFELENHEKIKSIVIEKANNPKHIDMVFMRFGFEPYNNPYTLEEIASKYNISRERVRQIILKILYKVGYKLKYVNDIEYQNRCKDKKLRKLSIK